MVEANSPLSRVEALGGIQQQQQILVEKVTERLA